MKSPLEGAASEVRSLGGSSLGSPLGRARQARPFIRRRYSWKSYTMPAGWCKSGVGRRFSASGNPPEEGIGGFSVGKNALRHPWSPSLFQEHKKTD